MAHVNGTGHASSIYIPPKDAFVPLIIDGQDVVLESDERHFRLPLEHNPTAPSETSFQGADAKLTLEAIESAERAFGVWSQTPLPHRRLLFFKMAQIIRENEAAIRKMVKEEIHCGDDWTDIQVHGAIGVIEETAAAMSSETMNGQIPPSIVTGAYPMVFNEPYGVILGMAPWNAPLILGFRSICAPLATGNTVIFKGSEFSPRTHLFIANLIRTVGFPPGACNFILGRPQDAVEIFNTCISHPAIGKVNFTGSTAVGRSIATTAAKHLKGVLLELGGKNISIVLEDADLEKAARKSIEAATINNGQVCMATDTILVHESVAKSFTSVVHQVFASMKTQQGHVISSKSRSNISQVLEDAVKTGAKVTQPPSTSSHGNLVPFTLIENLPHDSSYHAIETFGPVFAIHPIDTDDDIVKFVKATGYGLSSSIFSRNHNRAMKLARRLNVGAVHINGGSVHDESNLPHGGVANSGYGRFGGVWALREFTRTKTIMVYPDEVEE